MNMDIFFETPTGAFVLGVLSSATVWVVTKYIPQYIEGRKYQYKRIIRHYAGQHTIYAISWRGSLFKSELNLYRRRFGPADELVGTMKQDQYEYSCKFTILDSVCYLHVTGINHAELGLYVFRHQLLPSEFVARLGAYVLISPHREPMCKAFMICNVDVDESAVEDTLRRKYPITIIDQDEDNEIESELLEAQ